MLTLIAIVILCGIIIYFSTRYDARGFRRNGTHRNGTKYDDLGYDAAGYDRSGYDIHGFDRDGYDHSGYNISGYNRFGKNHRGQYNRCHDRNSWQDCLSDIQSHPVILTTHARERIAERMPLSGQHSAEKTAFEAYCYGKSKRQLRKSSAALVEEIEQNHGDSVVLIHRGYIFIFTADNKLITVYKNDRIPL